MGRRAKPAEPPKAEAEKIEVVTTVEKKATVQVPTSIVREAILEWLFRKHPTGFEGFDVKEGVVEFNVRTDRFGENTEFDGAVVHYIKMERT